MSSTVNVITWEEAQSRYSNAVNKVYDTDAIIRDLTKEVPGIPQEDNVFDLEDGMRMVISREVAAGGVKFHVSSSCWREPEPKTLEEVERWTLDNLNRVGQFDPPLTLESERIVKKLKTGNGVVHFWIE